MSGYDEAQWAISIDRDMYAILTTILTTGEHPGPMIAQYVAEQPPELQAQYATVLATTLARLYAHSMTRQHGGRDAALAFISAAAIRHEQAIAEGVWTTTTTPPPNGDGP